MTINPEEILFLPGASGNIEFWKPVAEALATPMAVQYMGWPGFGNTPANEQVTCLGHLAALAIAELNRPVTFVAQSIGGVVAAHIALERPTWSPT